MGIDPGTATTGYAIIEWQSGAVTVLDYGCILTPKEHTPSQRLEQLHQSTAELLNQWQPEAVAVEKLFFNTNVTTAMAVGEARGVILLAIEKHRAPIWEYTPLQVKMAVCGYGRATKQQVQTMTTRLLKLSAIPKPDDAADALAIALCHKAHAPMKAALS